MGGSEKIRKDGEKQKVEKKRKKEQYVVEEMIRLYCRKNHKEYDRSAGQMCPDCQALSDYARLRSDKCPLWRKRHSAVTVKCTATSPRCGRRSVR